MKTDEWQRITFKEIDSFPPIVKLNKSEPYPFIEMEDVNPAEKYAKNHSKKPYTGSGSKFKNGDILFARITPCLDNRKIAIAKIDAAQYGFGSTEFFVFRAIEK